MKKISILLIGILLVGSVVALTQIQNVTVNILPGEIKIYSPVQDKIYTNRMVLINISSFAELEYLKYSDNEDSLRTLCGNCNSYSKKRPFNEGFHQLTIFAIFDGGNIINKINFIVDSKKPIIKKTEPRGNRFFYGNFSVKYDEINLKEVKLFYGNSVNNYKNKTLTGCSSGKNKECITYVDLSPYDGQKIEYWFVIEDIAGNKDESSHIQGKIDLTPPILTINSPVNFSYGKKVPFNISVSEDVLLEYYDNLKSHTNWKKLCSNCDKYEKLRYFKKGVHNLSIRASDKAENFDIEQVSFIVNY